MEYNFAEIEKNWKKYWNDNHVYKVTNDTSKPKCYVLDMFPYPSGAGLHVGHPLGYIASDIYARYKRLKGYNVLHPMGFDAFGLPAEQYAIETGQHPADTTEKNIARYREQLDNIGFCYDWSREVRTSDPKYYKWTQWIFLQLFHSWYDRVQGKARPIKELEHIFEQHGNMGLAYDRDTYIFNDEEWRNYPEKEKRDILMSYRLAYQGYAQVWWCEALGTVLANDEVVNGVSERGGHPVERKNMRQWFLRITEYADRLLTRLDALDWTEAMKEMQRNWIGKSSGAEVRFLVLSPTPALPKGEGGDIQPREKDGWKTADFTAYNDTKQFKRELKNNPTEAEIVLWQQLRGEHLGVKFRRQHIIGPFIADFVCLTHNLIIEVDGKIHEEQAVEDAARTENLQERGFKVIRFTNEDVVSNTGNVVEKIKQQLKLQQNTSLPLGEGRGGAENQQHTSSPSGRSGGAFSVSVFTTRPDTIFGVDFLVLAPEHELVDSITTDEQRNAIDEYRQYVKSRSERERMSEVKQVTGCFTGAYAIHPFTHNRVPVWIAEYVLAGYGTGAIMAVPSGDDRDHTFAKHFDIPITNIFGDKYTGEAAYSDKGGTILNSGFLTGMSVADATEAAINALVAIDAGKRRTNYRLRDAGFSRQRYWGEPFPIIYIDDIPYGNDEPVISHNHTLGQLPVELPHVDSYKPGPEGQGPLANIEEWVETEAGERETNTMPGYAGSSWYFLRYMDPHNDTEFAGRAATDYWQQVDLYIGGTEHAVGHLLYSRMWTKALYDLGHLGFDEPFKKLLNQGMIQGKSLFIAKTLYLSTENEHDKISLITTNDNVAWMNEDGTPKQIERNNKKYIYKSHTEHRIPVQYTGGLSKISFDDFIRIINDSHVKLQFPEINESNISDTVLWHNDSEGQIIFAKVEVEKMSKSKYNVVNPDDIVAQYGADTFRMYEMFLGPIDVSKPWDTKGIEGVHRFLKKFWRLYCDEQKGWIINNDAPTDAELRLLHKTIKKISEDIERFSFNTSVSQFMICVNELTSLGCHKLAILEPLVIALCPFAPHIAEELWQNGMGYTGTVLDAPFPEHEEKYIVENSTKYPVAVNGKTRAEMEFANDAAQADVEATVLADATIQKWMEGKQVKKFIYVKGKMINVVV